jgi:hypothetical protein
VIREKDETRDSSEGDEGERGGPGACDAAQRSCAEQKPEHKRQPEETEVSRFESYGSRSGLKLFRRQVSGRLRQARILNLGCTKTRAFFYGPERL